jgi:hypothetical protein
MGGVAVLEMVRKLKSMLTERELPWKYRNTLMLDVFMRRERHVYLQPLSLDTPK